MFRRLFWLSVFVGVGYMFWRWVQSRSAAPTPAATAQLYTPPATSATLPPAGTDDAAPAAPTGRRLIPTRVHRGAPPSPQRPADATAAEASAEEPVAPEAPAAFDAPAAVSPAEAQPLPATPVDAPMAEPETNEAPVAEINEAPEAQSLVAASFDGTLTNINSADEEALIALPGIGPALARRIIAHREANGPFTTIEQLEVIQGIGPRNIAEFRHLVTI